MVTGNEKECEEKTVGKVCWLWPAFPFTLLHRKASQVGTFKVAIRKGGREGVPEKEGGIGGL